MSAFAEVGKCYLHGQSMRALLLGLVVPFRYWYLPTLYVTRGEEGRNYLAQVLTLTLRTRSSGGQVEAVNLCA